MATIKVRVQPRSSKAKIELQEDGSVKLWTSAPPVDGEANAAVIQALAKALEVPKSAVHIKRGEASRDKLIEVDGLTEEGIQERLGRA